MCVDAKHGVRLIFSPQAFCTRLKMQKPMTILSLIYKSRLVASAIFLFLQVSPAILAGQQDSFQSEPEDLFAKARHRMIDRDLRGRGIKDRRVLSAMDAVPRHLFVPENLRHSPYEDRPLPIGDGQTISQPYIVAYMSEVLKLQGHEKILDFKQVSGLGIHNFYLRLHIRISSW